MPAGRAPQRRGGQGRSMPSGHSMGKAARAGRAR